MISQSVFLFPSMELFKAFELKYLDEQTPLDKLLDEDLILQPDIIPESSSTLELALQTPSVFMEESIDFSVWGQAN